MQTANILLSLAGDSGNQVQKFGVTAAEIAVLNAIHGDGSVTDIEPAGDIKRSHREERARLLATYGKMQDGRDMSPVSTLFPGAAARVFETLAELDLPEEHFKATARMSATAPESEVDEPELPLAAPMTPAQKRAAKAAAKRAAKAAAKAAEAKVDEQPAVDDDGDDDDGIEDMNDKDVLA